MMRRSRRTLGCSACGHAACPVRPACRRRAPNVCLSPEMKGPGRPRRRVSPRRRFAVSPRCRLAPTPAGRQRVLTRQQSERDRDLSPPRNAELLPQHVAMRLRRPRRDAEYEPDLVVRQALRDQLDHLALPGGDAGGISECLHAARLRSRGECGPSAEGCIGGSRRRRWPGPMNDASMAPLVRRRELVLVERADPQQ